MALPWSAWHYPRHAWHCPWPAQHYHWPAWHYPDLHGITTDLHDTTLTCMTLPLTCMTLPWPAWHSAWPAWHYPKTAWHYHGPDQCSYWCAALGDGNSNETDPSDTVDRKHTLLAKLLPLQKFQSAGFHCTLHQWCPFLLHLYQSEKLHHSNQSSILLCTKTAVMHKMRNMP